MKKIVTLAIVVSTFIACNNTETQEISTTETENTNSASEANANSEAQFKMEETFPNANNNAASSNTTSGSAASGKLNPAHGEPGHRCEIPVGAPLDSEPSTPATTTINNTTNSAPAITPSFSAPTSKSATPPTFSMEGQQGKSSTPPGINPPHGEPGHDCAIPVGQPLKK